MQDACLEAERQFRELQVRIRTVDSRVARASDEKAFRAGQGQLLRDFKTWKDLFDAHIEQQEQLAKALRTRQKEIKEHATEHAVQRRLFDGLVRLLEVRRRTLVEEQRAAAATAGGGSALDTVAGVLAPGAGFDTVGGANVMTIE